MAQTVAVFEKDPKLAKFLAGGLRPHFKSVFLIESREKLRDGVTQSQPQALVLDLESGRLTDVTSLHRDFPDLTIVCTHRIPDEELWMAALEAGATDVCPADDLNNLLAAVLRSTERAAA
jgi:DNA-binding response OmpR family regulator